MDLNFDDAVTNTFEIVAIAVPCQLALALGMAMMLRHVRRGRDLLLWVWSIPLGISDLAAGLERASSFREGKSPHRRAIGPHQHVEQDESRRRFK